MGLVLCGAAFVFALLCSLRSAVAGLAVVLTTGYLFGIARANYLDTFSHFTFDSAILGLYLSLLAQRWLRPANAEQRLLQSWVGFLIGWVGLLFLVPIQHP